MTRQTNIITPALIQVLVIAVTLTVGPETRAEQVSPEEVYKGRPNNLEHLPPGWITENPIELIVSFNLKNPPNSAESDGFLAEWYKAISPMPDVKSLKIYRMVHPSQYMYAVSMTFNNWEEFRRYESSDEFLKFYYEFWKPRVSDVEERVYLFDSNVMTELP